MYITFHFKKIDQKIKAKSYVQPSQKAYNENYLLDGNIYAIRPEKYRDFCSSTIQTEKQSLQIPILHNPYNTQSKEDSNHENQATQKIPDRKSVV